MLSKHLRLCILRIKDQRGLLECAHLVIVGSWWSLLKGFGKLLPSWRKRGRGWWQLLLPNHMKNCLLVALAAIHQEKRLLRCLAIKNFILIAKPKGFSHLVILIASHILEDIYTKKRRLPWRLEVIVEDTLTCWSRDASVFLQFITGINWGLGSSLFQHFLLYQ